MSESVFPVHPVVETESSGWMVVPDEVSESSEFVHNHGNAGSVALDKGIDVPSLQPVRPNQPYIMPLIMAIGHGITKNFNVYTAETLRGQGIKNEFNGDPDGYRSFVEQTNKPHLVDHNARQENVVGRIRWADFDSSTGKIYIIPEITGEENVERVMDERFFTTSIGAKASEVVCNICEASLDMAHPFCEEHELGKFYEVNGQRVRAGRQPRNVFFDENSFVTKNAAAGAGIKDIVAFRESIKEGKFDYPDLYVAAERHIEEEGTEEEEKDATNEEKVEIYSEDYKQKVHDLRQMHDEVHQKYKEARSSSEKIWEKRHAEIVLELAKLGVGHKERKDNLDDTLADHLRWH